MAKADPFEIYVKEYESWFERNPWVYRSELEAIRSLLPDSGKGLEIGVGSGRFAGPLGIKSGVDPSAQMRALAEKRGIQVFDAKAEQLPFEDGAFDLVLMVTTICFVDDVLLAFKEAFRVLKSSGSMSVGFIDKDSRLGLDYQRKRSTSRFYRSARFYSAGEIIDTARQAGFRQFDCAQTLFGDIQQMNRADPVKEGKGDGSFVVVRAKKQ